MLSLPSDIFEAIIHEFLANKDIKSLSLVCSSLTFLCQRHLLSHLTIACSKAPNGNSERHQRSSYATRELLQSSPHLIPVIRSLSILGSGGTWIQIDSALLYILQSLTNLNRLTWRSSSVSSHPTHWNELPHLLQGTIKAAIRRPSLTALSLHFADLTDLLHTTTVVSPSLRLLRLRNTGYSSLTFELTSPSVTLCDDATDATLPHLLVTACKLEWIDDVEMFFAWISNIRPHLSFAWLRKLVILRCGLGSAPADELPWWGLFFRESVSSKLEELWFDIASTGGPPTG